MIAIVDPRQADAVLVGEAMPPLWQYLSRLQKGRRVHCCPKGRGPLDPCGFSPANDHFKGTAGRGQDRHRGPRPMPTPSWRAKAMPPLWQYFLRLYTACEVHRCSSPGAGTASPPWSETPRGRRQLAHPFSASPAVRLRPRVFGACASRRRSSRRGRARTTLCRGSSCRWATSCRRSPATTSSGGCRRRS
jgi:hypothetical protein